MPPHSIVATSGKLRWTYTTDAPIYSSPSVVGGMVFIGSSDHDVYALRATDGTLVWKYQTGDEVFSSPTVGP